ncbi:MAG: LamG domain-containing protein, partial [Planctomycetota bacterium]
DDPRWRIRPDHVHGKLKPGATDTVVFAIQRSGGTLDTQTRPIDVELAMDLLTDRSRFPIPPAGTTLLPGSLVLGEPTEPAVNHALNPGESGGATLAFETLGLDGGPFTIECHVQPGSYDSRDGVIGSSATGFWFRGGRPVFYVNAGGRWTNVEYPQDAPALATGRAYHFAGTWDGETASFYLDGQLVDRVAAAGELRLRSGPFTVGADSRRRGPRNPLNGWVDAVRVSQGVRYTADGFIPDPRPETDGSTLLLLHMDGRQGDYLFDHSGRAAHVRLRGDAAVVTAE